jgi:hypothetical protein
MSFSRNICVLQCTTFYTLMLSLISIVAVLSTVILKSVILCVILPIAIILRNVIMAIVVAPILMLSEIS